MNQLLVSVSTEPFVRNEKTRFATAFFELNVLGSAKYLKDMFTVSDKKAIALKRSALIEYLVRLVLEFGPEKDRLWCILDDELLVASLSTTNDYGNI